MPGYRHRRTDRSSGLLPLVVGCGAAEPLRATTGSPRSGPTARPHIMPVWGVWDDSTLLVYVACRLPKVRNLTPTPLLRHHRDASDR